MSQRKKAVKSQVKTNQKTNTFEFGVFNLAIPEHIEEPYSDKVKEILERKGVKYKKEQI